VKISCPSCSAKYSIADEKVQDRLAKIRCRKCGTTIVIDGKVSPASVYAADGGDSGVDAGATSADAEHSTGSADSAAEYTVDFGDNDQRPMTVAQIVAAYNSGTVTADTYLWAEGFADWKPLGEVDEVVAALHAAASAPGAVAPAAAVAAAPAAAETPWQAPRAAAAPAPAAATGRDLFGGYDSAGSEDDVATSTGGAAQPVAAPFGGASAVTGARNESSVLFSLSALTSATSRPSGPPPSSATSEDSGLIDLKALTSAAEAHPATSPLAAPPGLGGAPLGAGAPFGGAPLGAAPFGAAAPFGGSSPYGMGVAPAVDLSIPQQPKSRTGLYFAIIGGMVASVVAVTLILQLTGKSEAAAPVVVTTSATTTALPAPTPTPAPTAAAAPTTDAKPPATGTSAEEAAPGATTAPKTGGTKKYSGTGGTKKPASTSSTSSGDSKPAAEKPAAPKPAANKCGCKPGDLACAMRCAAGG
jgi:predicted Zn finger-like uncharacterized protein